MPKSTDEGLIWVTVKFGVLAPCFLREGASDAHADVAIDALESIVKHGGCK